ncbi:hypothetical protein, partial [Mesorhizobium sp. B2-1-5]|uniref:hypothetical protein n=2 Tax=unclassified Mesorhizobium TaxID=325217 RepID=UPI001AEEBD91
VNRFDAKTEADRSCATKPDNLISYRQARHRAWRAQGEAGMPASLSGMRGRRGDMKRPYHKS